MPLASGEDETCELIEDIKWLYAKDANWDGVNVRRCVPRFDRMRSTIVAALALDEDMPAVLVKGLTGGVRRGGESVLRKKR